MDLEHATLVFLVIVFVAAEVYRGFRGQPGMIVSVNNAALGPLPLPMAEVSVRLSSTEEVSASLDCCTACLGRLNVGDEVRVLTTKEGYRIDLPWFRHGDSTVRFLDAIPDSRCHRAEKLPACRSGTDIKDGCPDRAQSW